MRQKVFVVMGATGQVGSVVAQTLLKKGHRVKALGRDAKKLKALQSAEVITIDKFDDEIALTKAFEGADGVFAFIPPAYNALNSLGFMDDVGVAIKNALQKTNVPYVVNLSSFGAQIEGKTGPILGLHRQEKRLNELQHLNIIHLRPDFFMENLFGAIAGIKETGTLLLPFVPHAILPMVSTEDIGLKAAAFLDSLDFEGHTHFDFTGPEDLTVQEITTIMGAAIGKPDLKCIQQSYEEVSVQLQRVGMTTSAIESMIEMYQAFNAGKIPFTQEMTSEHRGQMTFELFAKKFAKVYGEIAFSRG